MKEFFYLEAMVSRRATYLMLIPAVLLSGVYHSAGQSLDELQKKKQSAAREIRVTHELLGQVTANQKATLGKLRLINSQIHQQEELISAISSEVSLMQSIMDDNRLVIGMLTADLAHIRAEYAAMVRFAWKNRNAYDKLLFFLSSDDVNQAYRRFVYLRQYTDYRRKQAEIISSVSDILERKTRELTLQQSKQKTLLSEQEAEKQKLDHQKNRQSGISRQLTREKSALQKKLDQQRRIERDLEKEIQRIIEEEAQKSAKAGKKGFMLTPEQKTVGDSFEQNRRRLPWPVEKGVITEHFGIHPHPVLKNVSVNSNGVSITTEAGAKARAVFAGEVSRVFGISGGNTAVILRHGLYLSVYSNLLNVSVKKGDKVAIRQNLGTVFTDRNDGDRTILKFQIWKESQKMDPEEWLSR